MQLSQQHMNATSPILTITGSDPTSGSGIQADLNTISALGGYAMSAVTSITVQTTLGIQEFYDVPAKIVAGQIEAVMNDFQPEVVKIGLLRTREVLDVVVAALRRYRPRHVVYDPVFLSSRGDPMMTDALKREIAGRLVPLCTVVVRLDEAAQMHGRANRYASAVAVFLSQGDTPAQAQERARHYMNTQPLRTADLQGRGSELYNEFLGLVARHSHTNSDVHFYADQLNVSARYLAQVARRISGKAPKALIDEHLIGEAERLLQATDRTVQETAYSLGFSSQAHFTKFFKKMKGMSPTKFRKQ